MENYKFDFDDILITPATTSKIKSRFSDITLEYLPLITAPMDTVVNSENYQHFKKNGITVCLPRPDVNNLNWTSEKEVFHSMSLEEFKKLNDNYYREFNRICIDTANGHTKELHDVIKKFKKQDKHGIEIMTGNIGNPLTLIELDKAGVDYVRVGIGFGGGCLTAQQTGIGYAMGSLINECYTIKEENGLKIKIIADGGMKKYSDIIKAIALGADYVMLGSIFNKAMESCAPTHIGNKEYNSWTEPGDKINQYDPTYAAMLKSGTKFYKKFRGMSTKEVQKEWGKKDIKTSEGITKLNEVEYTIAGWVENFDHYLRSAMSYCNCENLEQFRNNSQITLISPSSFNRFKK